MQTHAPFFEKSRNEDAFCQAAIEIQSLKDQAASGEIELAYLDDAGFSAVHPNRSAWTQRGQCHLIEAKRGKRLNVLAALLSSGRVLSATYWETTTAEAKSTRIFTQWLAQQGVTLYFLPPYSLELNRIERLWHKIKNTRGWPSNAELPKTWRLMWGISWTTLGRRINLISMASDLL